MEKHLSNKPTKVMFFSISLIYAEVNPIAENLKGENRTGHRMKRTADLVLYNVDACCMIQRR